MKRALFALCVLLSPRPAMADTLPLRATLRLGQPEASVAIRVEASGDHARLTAGPRRADLPIALDEADVRTVPTADGAVAIVHGRGERGEITAVITVFRGAPNIVFAGRTDLHGDPGERTADLVSLEDRTGDGQADIVIGLRREGATLCGEAETVLAPSAYDARSGTLRPVVLRRIDGGAATAITASRTSPGPAGPPSIGGLRLTGSSSRAGAAESEQTAPARVLTDGRLDTFWAEGRGGPGGGEFVVGRPLANLPIRAFALVIAPTGGESAAALGRPRTVYLRGEEGPPLRVVIPEDALAHPGERYWVTPAQPLDWGCIALVLDEAFAPRGVDDAAVHTGLAEIEVYTTLDFGEGIDGLVAMMVEGGASAEEAARLLFERSALAAPRLSAAWDRLDAQGRRRSVRVFREAARNDPAAPVAALVVAARDEDEGVRRSAIEALGTPGPAAGSALRELIMVPGEPGEDAVRALLRHEPTFVLGALFDALAAEGGADRPALREGLMTVLRRGGAPATTAFEAWLASEPPVGAVASAALGLTGHRDTRGLAGPAVSRAIRDAETFEDRWRAVTAAARAPADETVDQALVTLASSAEEWMLRAAALQALGERESSLRAAAARTALEDDYPRVQVAAVAVLDALGTGDDDEVLAGLVDDDSWPMVRQAAIVALWDRPTARRAVRRAVRDRSPAVRRAAIEALLRGGDREAFSYVRARLEDDEEWPQVTVAALRYVEGLCLVDAAAPVTAVIQRGMGEDAWPPDVDVAALAVDVALRLGGSAAEEAERLVRRTGTPPSVVAAFERRAATPEPCHP